MDKHSEAALKLAFLTQSPTVLAALVPRASRAFRGYQGTPSFAAALLPEDAQELAELGEGERIMVAHLTDDPEALSLIAMRTSHLLTQELVAQHPLLPLESLIRMVSQHMHHNEKAEQVLSQRVRAGLPSAQLIEVALEVEGDLALRELMLHPELGAPEALRVILSESRSGEYVSGREDLPVVLGRDRSGGSHSLEVLTESIELICARIPVGTKWFAPQERQHRGGATALWKLAESPQLGLGYPVGEDLLVLLGRRPEVWPHLSQRVDLSEEACAFLAGEMWRGHEDLAQKEGKTLEEEIGDSGWESRNIVVPLARLLSGLTHNPHCPPEVAEMCPAHTEDLTPLARLLPEDPRVWEVAAALMGDSPTVTFGEVAAAACSAVH